MTHLVPLAEVDQNKVTPGVLGFIVFAVMALAVWGLMKSMNKHMRKVDFKEADASGEDATEASGTAKGAPKAQRG
ncbi:membrane protein [Streptomyces hygroscopicus]|nr:membrane protein [Streptomyces hygroscopicus]